MEWPKFAILLCDRWLLEAAVADGRDLVHSIARSRNEAQPPAWPVRVPDEFSCPIKKRRSQSWNMSGSWTRLRNRSVRSRGQTRLAGCWRSGSQRLKLGSRLKIRARDRGVRGRYSGSDLRVRCCRINLAWFLAGRRLRYHGVVHGRCVPAPRGHVAVHTAAVLTVL